jgi:hypothetical protein
MISVIELSHDIDSIVIPVDEEEGRPRRIKRVIMKLGGSLGNVPQKLKTLL